MGCTWHVREHDARGAAVKGLPGLLGIDDADERGEAGAPVQAAHRREVVAGDRGVLGVDEHLIRIKTE